VQLGAAALNSLSTDTPVFEVRFPSESKPRKIYPLTNVPQQVQIPVFNENHEQTGTVLQQLLLVTDQRELYGVIAPSSEGFFGTLVNQSSTEAEFYQLSPHGSISTKGTSAPKFTAHFAKAPEHELVKMSAAELASEVHCGNEASEHAPTLQRRQIGAGTTVLPSAAKLSNPLPSVAQKSGWRGLEIFAVSSAEFSGSRSEDAITAQISSTVAAANIFFQPLELQVRISGVQILRSSGDPYSAAAFSQDAQLLLDVLQKQWEQRFDIQRDAVVLFATGNYRGIRGLAYTGSSCVYPDLSIAFVSTGGTGASKELGLAGTLAHELGHVLGMHHDSTLYSKGPSIMYPTFSMNVWGFSEYSNKEYLKHAGPNASGGSCLTEIDPPSSAQFEGGVSETIRIREGEKFSRIIRLEGTGLQATLALKSIPAGAKFDPATGLFEYAAPFAIGSKRAKIRTVTITLTAELSDGQLLNKTFVFEIQSGNSAPKAAFRSTTIYYRAGVNNSFALEFTDADGDELELSARSVGRLRRISGRKNIRFRNGVLSMTWVPETGFKRVERAELEVTDGRGGRVAKLITFRPY